MTEPGLDLCIPVSYELVEKLRKTALPQQRPPEKQSHILSFLLVIFPLHIHFAFPQDNIPTMRSKSLGSKQIIIYCSEKHVLLYCYRPKNAYIFE